MARVDPRIKAGRGASLSTKDIHPLNAPTATGSHSDSSHNQGAMTSSSVEVSELKSSTGTENTHASITPVTSAEPSTSLSLLHSLRAMASLKASSANSEENHSSTQKYVSASSNAILGSISGRGSISHGGVDLQLIKKWVEGIRYIYLVIFR